MRSVPDPSVPDGPVPGATVPDATVPGATVPLADVDLRALFAELLAVHGPQGSWWPGEEPFEIAVGAVLVQRSRWEQAAAAIARLRAADLLTPAALAAVPEGELQDLVRAAGFPTQKPRRLHALAVWMRDRAPLVPEWDDATLRSELLAVVGIGEETADAIGLYCFGRPAFLCDEYARRLLTDRGVVVPRGYPAFRRGLAPALERAAFTVPELAELHGLVVEEGKRSATLRRRRAAPPRGALRPR